MNASPIKYFVVDAFTDRPFSGNPAAVVPLDGWKDDAWLQNVAMEMNLAETAYLVPNATGFDLRWFTPTVEVDLCGHATIASAVVLMHQGKLADGADVVFSTRSGLLKAGRQGTRIQLDFPRLDVEPADAVPGLIDALGATVRFVGRSRFDILVEVESESVVRRLKPNIKQIATIPCRGVIVTARSDDPRFDFVSRFFAPAVGVDEDPVCGSAHCSLAPYWGKHLGKSPLVGYQASARGGIVHVEIRGQRVMLGGDGVIFATGEMAV